MGIFQKNCQGKIVSEPKLPPFSKTDADNFYPKTYSIPKEVNLENLNCFPNLPIPPDSPEYVPFNKIQSSLNMLKRFYQNVTRIQHLVQMEYLTEFSSNLKAHTTFLPPSSIKVFSLGSPPVSWSESIVKLAHKKGNTADITNC